MIVPILKDDAFLSDVASTRGAAGFRLWWLGQSGFLLQHQDRHLLLDPYLSDSLTRKYAATDKPHVRMTERIVDPSRLGLVDVITSSHVHTDHLDGETLAAVLAASPRARLVIPEAIRAIATERLGAPATSAVGLDEGQETEVAGFRIAAVPAAHEEIERDEHGRSRHLGYVVRFGAYALYHAGDCVRYEGQAERLRRDSIDVALLPINGRAPERRVSGNFTGAEAAQLARDANTRLAVPCHYEMFEFNTASPGAFAAEAARLGQPYRVLRCGERFSDDELPT
jgi:L-ascorbate metabolism protein UlaG (beta-lactamase superfamily)